MFSGKLESSYLVARHNWQKRVLRNHVFERRRWFASSASRVNKYLIRTNTLLKFFFFFILFFRDHITTNEIHRKLKTLSAKKVRPFRLVRSNCLGSSGCKIDEVESFARKFTENNESDELTSVCSGSRKATSKTTLFESLCAGCSISGASGKSTTMSSLVESLSRCT